MLKYVGIALATIGFVLALVAIPFATTDIRVPKGDCGTIFAAKDSWTYESSYAGIDSYLDSATSYDPGSINRAGQLGIQAMLDDMAEGSRIYEACENAHHDRMVLLTSILVPAVVLLMVGIAQFVVALRRRS